MEDSVKSKQKEHFDAIASEYSQKIDENSYNYYFEFTKKTVLTTLQQYFPDFKNCKGLDLGCGNGDFTASLAKDCQHLTGVDLSEGMIKQAQINFKAQGLEFIPTASDTLPFSDSTFDFCISLHLFHHLITKDNIENTIKEMKRVTRKDGLIVILDTNKINPLSFFAQYLMKVRGVDTGDEKLVWPKTLLKLFDENQIQLFKYQGSCCIPHITPKLKGLNPTLENSIIGKFMAKDYVIAGLNQKAF